MDQQQMGRQIVRLETILCENGDGELIRQARAALISKVPPRDERAQQEIVVPDDATRSGVSGKVYGAWRKGLATACSDVVCVQYWYDRYEDETKKIASHGYVPLIRRAAPPFGGCWWIMGGALFNFRSNREFLFWKLLSEGGVEQGGIDEVSARYGAGQRANEYDLHVVGCLGTYRTAAEDTAGTGKPPCDTINLCYMALVCGGLTFGHDRDHTDVWFASAEELLPEDSCGHWYPRHVALRALDIYHRAAR